jgi:diguanylate cyclase (GGDEF)-like protein/PAS domain S-box-containing protein
MTPEAGTVLIVDDNSVNLQVLGGILELAGYQFRPALSGELALKGLDSFLPDLILLDIRMPGMDGYAVCTAIKNNTRTKHIPVIFLSALQDISDKEKAFAVGGVDYVTKPFQETEIIARVKTHIQLHRLTYSLEQMIAARTREMENSEARYRVLFEDSPQAVIVFDMESHHILKVNRACSRILGYSEEKLLAHDISFFVERGQRDNLLGLSEKLTGNSQDNAYTGVLHLHHEDGHMLHTEGILHCIEYSGHRAQILMLQDITAQRQAEEKLQQAAKEHQKQLTHATLFDQLTGLPSRLLLDKYLQQSIEHVNQTNSSMAICYLDFDKFGQINERYGQHNSDNLLVSATTSIRNCLRGGDVLARIGSDEFVLLLMDIKTEVELSEIIDYVHVNLAKPYIADDFTCSLSASIGITLFPTDQSDPDTLLRHADQAMMEAKQRGKGQTQRFDPEINKRIRLQQETIVLMREALARREFVLYFQPKVDMKHGLVVGAEALIRWQHPERGLLLPGVFLPTIEDDLFMVELSEWVITEALTRMESWRAQGLDLAISVNISALHLLQENFVERLIELLAEHPQTPMGRLEIEVLETSELENLPAIQKIISECHKLGVGFSLDDFGTGYSSLTYLRQLDADTLKIDQTFVRNMLEVSEDLAIISGVIGLAVAFKRKIIAEGVETVAHGKALLALGCPYAQGYGIARPMLGEDMADWVRKWPDAAWLKLTN